MSFIDFVVSDFWGWDAHEAQLRCPDEVECDIWIWSTRMGLNLSSTKLPRPWSPWKSSPIRKNPHGRNGNRTRDLMISSQKLWPLDHDAGLTKQNKTVKLKVTDFHVHKGESDWKLKFRAYRKFVNSLSSHRSLSQVNPYTNWILKE
jgi:hypothetical protein